ncbi:hypothetical protein B0H13DRAFT_2005651 [Mycena leptocephala]|nr:hypothetical protein B0H13DRAFT_2005651 [Mycena leptocephala]
MSKPVRPSPVAHAVLEVSAREQCLQNSDLLGEILGHIPSEPDRDDLKAERQSLLWIALTLDNLVPLLRLLRSFTIRNGIYVRPLWAYGLNSHEWKSFERHTPYVKEIVYKDISDTRHIDPSVYLRLCLRNSPVLPSLRRFVCTATMQPSASEILVYMQSPLQAIELSSNAQGSIALSSMALTREMVVSSLLEKPSDISSLILISQPFSILSEGIPLALEYLTSLELRCMVGAMDATLLRRIGSLSHLRSFTVDSGCFSGLDFDHLATRLGQSTPFHFEQNSRERLFMELTHFKVEGNLLAASRPPFGVLQIIGSDKLQSLTFAGYPWARSGRGGFRGGRGRGRGRADPAPLREMHEDALHIIARRWSKSLRHLDLHVDHSHIAVSNLLARLSALRVLRLSGCMRVADDGDICSIFAGLAGLEALSLYCGWGSNIHMQLDIRSITGLLQKFRCDKFIGGNEAHASWAQVQELVFAFQDVRRKASRNVAKV